MPGARDYQSWTKEGLLKRIKQLEAELEGQKHHMSQLGAPPPSSSAKQAAPAPAPALETSSPEDAAVATQATEEAAAIKKKKKKGIPRDASNYSTRYIALKLAYLGGNYNGLEYQPSGALPAIEEELWKALVKTCLIFPDPDRGPDEVDFRVCDYSKCGRTDRGVSAFGQVVALRVKSNKPVRRRKDSTAAQSVPKQEADKVDPASAPKEAQEVVDKEQDNGNENDDDDDDDDDTPYPVEKEIRYCKTLNAVLPPDIRAVAWCPDPPPGFSARHSCHERQYRYFFTQPAFSPVPSRLDGVLGHREQGSGHKDGYLDLEAMREAARMFEGEHDFRNFCKVDPSKQITNFKRDVREASIVEVADAASALPYLSTPEFRPAGADVERAPKVYYFHVRGSAFLWHQIRHMVAVLFLVGQRLEKPSIVRELLDVQKHPGKPNYAMASDAPLVLWDCLYGGRGPLLPDGSPPGELEWVYSGADHERPEELYGRKGLLDELWAGWRSKKMEELLANQLLQRVAVMVEDPERAAAAANKKKKPAATADSGSTKKGKQPSRKLFEGDAWYRLAGNYVPLCQRPVLETAEEVNDKWARSKGFESAADMRENPEWRTAIRAKKAAAAAAASAVSASANDKPEEANGSEG